MSDPFVAEIRIFAGNFAPTGWAMCNGQIMPLSQNTALFALLGTMYGGDGKSNFALPNLQGAAPMMWGQGPGLSMRDIGESGGSQNVTLLESEIPAHAHVAQCNIDGPTASSPTGNTWAPVEDSSPAIYGDASNLTAMHPAALSVAGSSSPHNNMQPYLCLNFIIALQGIFPPRS